MGIQCKILRMTTLVLKVNPSAKPPPARVYNTDIEQLSPSQARLSQHYSQLIHHCTAARTVDSLLIFVHLYQVLPNPTLLHNPHSRHRGGGLGTQQCYTKLFSKKGIGGGRKDENTKLNFTSAFTTLLVCFVMIVLKFQLCTRARKRAYNLEQVSFCSLSCDILISSLHEIPYSFSNYLSLKTLEVQNCENMRNTLKIKE